VELRYDLREGQKDESAAFGQEDVRKVFSCTEAGRSVRDLSKPQTQATARIGTQEGKQWHVSQASTFLEISGS